ncbi:potassium transporter TrkG [Bosea sp. 117]|uniref:TrkH family potassium uptake protein n=1 Tax=Bosea sp. 117 TaxID=1125973 RepID=UPI0004949640|nr:potassium transporter TrkG [Bosea sp. 117]
MIAVAQRSVLAAGVVAGFMLFAALIGIAHGEREMFAYVLTAALIVFAAGAVHFGTRSQPARFDRLSSYVLLVMLWVGIPVVAAIPVAMTTPLGPVDAWFEAVAALTTTGATQIHEIENLPASTLAWLLSLQWLGGLLTLVGFIAVLAPAGIGGLPDRATHAAQHWQSEATALDDALRQVLPIYVGATLACMLALFALGVSGFEAFGLASAVVSTGGLLPDADGIAAYGDEAVKIVLMVFMLIGGTSILWHRMLVTRRFRLALAQHENLAVIAVAGMIGLLVAAAWFRAPGEEWPLTIALEDGLFTGISLVTTTGIEPHAGAFASLPLSLVTLLVFVGGASFSTSGGIKMYRLGQMVVQSIIEVERLIHPHEVRPRRLGMQRASLQTMKAIWLCFAVACICVVTLAALIAPAMPSFEAAYVAAIAVLTNAGPIYLVPWQPGVIWPEWGTLPVYAQVVLAAGMILGRLEILVALGLVHFAWWRG